MKKIYHLITRYKLVHIVYWVYVGLNLYHTLQLMRGRNFVYNEYDLANDLFFQMLATYVTVYVLTKTYFYRQKYLAFFVSWLAVCVICTVLNSVVARLYVNAAAPPGQMSLYYLVPMLSHFIDNVRSSLIFLIVFLIEHYVLRDLYNRRLEKDLLESELNFLKAQMNPHFMFNALNNIYFLIDQDKERSKEILIKFSSLLRYQLYECSAARTPLRSELAFIKDYIALETIRKASEVTIETSFPKSCGQQEIAPLLLIPFIENAFKHVSNKTTEPNYIRIGIELAQDELQLQVENSRQYQPEAAKGGLGIQNARRRLELIYPDAHQLVTSKESQRYIVQLKIRLK